MVTIKDVAALAGVSIATVSRVINTPEFVSEKRKKAVLDAIANLNYHPNDIARSLQRNNSSLIGILAPSITNVFTSEIISILATNVQQEGYSTFLAISNHSPQTENNIMNLMLEKRVAGIILLGSRLITEENDELLDIAARTVPIVVIDYTTNCNMYCVRTDEAAGVAKAVKYLHSLGHRHIAFINGPVSLISHHYKNVGYKQAMADLGLQEIAQEYAIEVSPDHAGGAKGVSILLNNRIAPTAILTGGDTIAIGAYYGLKSHGFSIPNDISLIGFSGSTSSKYMYPPITTVDQKPSLLGTIAAHTMIDILNGKSDINRNVIIEPDLLIRKSCRAL